MPCSNLLIHSSCPPTITSFPRCIFSQSVKVKNKPTVSPCMVEPPPHPTRHTLFWCFNEVTIISCNPVRLSRQNHVVMIWNWCVKSCQYFDQQRGGWGQKKSHLHCCKTSYSINQSEKPWCSLVLRSCRKANKQNSIIPTRRTYPPTNCHFYRAWGANRCIPMQTRLKTLVSFIDLRDPSFCSDGINSYPDCWPHHVNSNGAYFD